MGAHINGIIGEVGLIFDLFYLTEVNMEKIKEFSSSYGLSKTWAMVTGGTSKYKNTSARELHSPLIAFLHQKGYSYYLISHLNGHNPI